MASRNGQQQKDLADQQHRHQKDLQLTQAGQQAQQEQLRDLLHNPQVIDQLLTADLSHDDEWVVSLLGEHLHIDEVLAVLDDDSLWRKGWSNRIKAGKTQMSFPPSPSRSPDDRVNDVQQRMHGVDDEPLTPRKRQTVNAKMDQKTDRAKRADRGTFLELLLSQVVKSEEKASTEGGGGGRISDLLGRDR